MRYFLLAAFLLSAPAWAVDPRDLKEGVRLLQDQLKKVDKQGGASCPAEFSAMNAEKDLRISLFYGYEDYEDMTADQLHALAMAKVLQQSCRGGIAACGFRVVSRSANLIQLQRNLNGRDVKIKIHHTSVSEDNAANSNWGSNQWAQYAQSQLAWRNFHRALRNSDVVFYAGHSRLGAGLGFNIQSWGQDAFNYLTRAPLRATLDVLSERPSRLKLLGLFGCGTNNYYREPMMRANPSMDMLVSHADLDPEEGEQKSISALNSILSNKCRKDFNASMDSLIEPGKGRMELVKRGSTPKFRTVPSEPSHAPVTPAL